ncbi:Tc toxin subunit A-related protein [Pseudomonas sp. LB3P25]
MVKQQMGELAALRRNALIDFCIGMKDVDENEEEQSRIHSLDDLFEWLRTDPADSDQVMTSWIAEAVSCFQQYIHAVYQKLEPGYTGREFPQKDLQDWDIASNYPVWAASQLLKCTPEDYITPYARIRKTSLFKALESNLNQTRLTTDSVQRGVQEYLRVFEETCNLEVLSGYVDGADPRDVDYYFLGRERIEPHRYFWRKAAIELDVTSVAVNPAAWGEWQPADIAAEGQVLDSRLVFWGGRLCLVWAQWHKALLSTEGDLQKPHELELSVAFIALNGQWSPPVRLHLSQYATDVSKDLRMVAVALRDVFDVADPNGRLAVHVTNGDNTAAHATPVEIYETRDSLFRKMPDEGPVMDYLALEAFSDRLTVQQAIAPGEFPSMTRSVTAAGTLTDHYILKTSVVRWNNMEYLRVQGHCTRVDPLGAGTKQSIKLEVKFSSGTDPAPITGDYSDNGGWSTPWILIERASMANTTVTCTLGGAGVGTNTYTIKIVTAPVARPLPLLHKTNAQGAQFLNFNQPEPQLKLKYVRLNTLIGAELVFRANLSMDEVLDWTTQFPNEPDLPVGTEPNGPFDGCNGLFFWELFFHLPHLVASRLRDENRFLEAQQWLHYLFDPQAPADAAVEVNPKPEYWRCRPLNVDQGNIGCEANAPTDPDAIAYSSPWYYKIVIFLEYVTNIIAWGDWHYRQLTRDSLAAAKLQYVRAQTLMGPTPDTRSLSKWEPAILGDLVKEIAEKPDLQMFEKGLVLDAGQLPVRADHFENPGVIGTKSFKLPVSPRLLDIYGLPARRIFNLRHNLTLDGKPLSIPFFSPPLDPSALLSSLAAGGTGSALLMGGQLRVAAFRWRVLFDSAMRAVQLLQEFGNQVVRLLEQQDRAEQEEVQQRHLVELGGFAQKVQDETIAQLRASLTALQRSKTMTEERRLHYETLESEHISDAEYQVMASIDAAKTLAATSTGFQTAGAAIDVAPTIFGLANGGYQLGNIPRAIGFGIQIASEILLKNADKTQTSENYRRRRQEWRLARDQAAAEINSIDAQIESQERSIAAAEASLAQTLRANAQAVSMFEFLKNRASNLELYRWQLGQLKTLHYQAYDAVVGLCLSAQTALQAETCEFGTGTIRPDIWLDSRHGLTAGDSLRLDLQRMEANYLQRYERRLELVKTVSLRQLFEDTSDSQEDFDCWEDALDELRNKSGTLSFNLRQLLFDRDYPDHYCRQISAVEVTLPILKGPFEDVRATLLQVGSFTATQPSIPSLEYLHAPGDSTAPTDVLINLGSGQQVALSIGLDDTGMTTLKPDEGLLNPFENTGAVSRWQLTFPWRERPPQAAMLSSLTDIVIRIRYTAKVAADAAFAAKVRDLVKLADPKPATPSRVNRHE